MMLPQGALVAVVDGRTFKLFRNRGAEPQVDLVEFAHAAVHPVNPGSGLRHHSESSNHDSGRKAEDGFAAATAIQLNHLALDGTIESLFVIADPRTLGELRKHFNPALHARIIGELAKDLTDHPVQDIASAIRHV